MARKIPDASKDLEKKEQKATKLFDTFSATIKDKKSQIQHVAQDAKNILRTINSAEKQSAIELTKIKSNASKEVSSLKRDTIAVADRAKKSIKEAFDEVDSTRSDTRKSYNRFKNTYNAAINGDRGINARKHDVESRHEKIKVAHNEINQINESAHNQLVQITDARVDTQSSQKQVNEVRDRAEEIRKEIENTYHITIDSAMGGALNERKREIQRALNTWGIALFVSVLVLVGAIAILIEISLTSQRESINLLESVTNRLVYLTPILFVIFMTYRQYSHERRLLEEYAFKATMAQSLRNYAVLLSDNYGNVDKADEKILDFLLGSMTNIYDRSILDNTSNFFYQFIVGNKHMGAQATVQEGGVSEVKQTTSKKVETKEEKTVK